MSHLIMDSQEIINLEYLKEIEINEDKQLQNILTAYSNYLHSSFSFFAVNNNEKNIIKSTLGSTRLENEILSSELAPGFSENKEVFFYKNLNENSARILKNLWNSETVPTFYFAISLRNENGCYLGFLGFLFKESFQLIEDKKIVLKTLNTITIEYLKSYCLRKEQKKKIKEQNEKLVHDLRNPLTIISLHTELIKAEDNISEDAKDACVKIGEAIKKLSEIAFEFIKE